MSEDKNTRYTLCKVHNTLDDLEPICHSNDEDSSLRVLDNLNSKTSENKYLILEEGESTISKGDNPTFE